MQAIILPFLAVVHLVSAAATTACNANNCLRAIRASAFPTRSGTADCSSYFMVTVTPATSTFTSTVVTTITPAITTITASTTNTITPLLSTEVDSITVTSTPAVVTVSSTSTSTTTLFPSCVPQPVIAPKRDVTPKIRGLSHIRQVKQQRAVNHKAPALLTASIQARQITTSPSSIPTYASACSGAVQYSSACSCIGVTHSTSTAVAPSTTVTQTNTVTAPTPTATTTLTFSTTLIPLTTTISNTITNTVIASTTTSTIISIVTVTPAPYCSFKLVNNSPGDSLDGTYVVVTPNDIGAGTTPFYGAPGDSSAASIFNCDASAHLINNANYAVVPSGLNNYFFDFDQPPNAGEDLITCPVDANGLAQCSVNGASVVQYCDYQGDVGNILTISTGLDEFDDGRLCALANLVVVPLGC